MKEIRTEIKINAPPSAVWDILTDFSRYPEWNPFIPDARGTVREGARLTIRIEPPNRKTMIFRPRVTRVAEGREFRWRGSLIVPGLFDGEHIFEITPNGRSGVKFNHRERFKGILVPFFLGLHGGEYSERI